RSIRDRFIQHALREAYRGLTEPGRHPAAILMIDIPPQDVDVNVHPTKSEVRFRDGGRIHGLVLSSIREKLLGSDLTPAALASVDDPNAPRLDMREKLAAFFRTLPSDVAAPDTGFPLTPSPGTPGEGGGEGPSQISHERPLPPRTLPTSDPAPAAPALQLHNA